MFGRPPSFRCPDCGDRKFAIDHIEKDHKIHMAKAKARLESIECAVVRFVRKDNQGGDNPRKGRTASDGRPARRRGEML